MLNRVIAVVLGYRPTGHIRDEVATSLPHTGQAHPEISQTAQWHELRAYNWTWEADPFLGVIHSPPQTQDRTRSVF